jgi:hypothetical protein
MANLIIHLMPSMALYTLRWHATELHETYPKFFNLEYLDVMTSQDHDMNGSNDGDLLHPSPKQGVGELPFWKGIGQSSVAWNALMVYFAWWIPYTIFMLTVGLNLPVHSKDKSQPPPKYDTVFHSLWRGGPCELVGSLLWKRPKEISQDQSERNDFEVRDLMVYMIAHAVGCIMVGIGVVAGISYVGGQKAHACMLLLATTVCANRGAQRYTYYVTAMYGKKLRKAYKTFKERQGSITEGAEKKSE